MASRIVRGWFVLCAVGLMGSCGDDAPQENRVYPSVVAGCENQFFGQCDVRQSGCQSRLLSTMQCLRQGPSIDAPEVRVITRDLFLEETLGEIVADSGEEQETEEQQRRAIQQRSLQSVLVRLGLARQESFSDEARANTRVANVAGYYTPNAGDITLIVADDPSTSSYVEKTLTLVHEFVHALQFRDGRPGEEARSFDASLARGSTIEGEAEMLESFFRAAEWQLEGEVDFPSYFLNWVDRAEENLEDTPVLDATFSYFPYSYGANYIYRQWQEGGSVAVQERVSNPPISSLDIITPFSTKPRPAIFELSEAPAAVGDLELVGEDRLGPWIARRFLSNITGPNIGSELYEHWRGGGFFLYGNAESNYAGLWILRFDSVENAQEFARLANESPRDTIRARFDLTWSSGVDAAVLVQAQPGLLDEWQQSAALAVERATLQTKTSVGLERKAESSITKLLLQYLAQPPVN